ncbi:MAG TPA: hypothetical protein VGO11_12830 [Chthoniobacteraceae bacterium]|jgi:hypothetical protein|nr:hypothetical protein [Chthoniobacteraceae bacterium]
MTPEAELAHLRQEVATMRKQLNAVLRFVTIEVDEGTGEPVNMNLRCGVVLFQNPHDPQKTQMFMGGSEEGPFVSLWDSQEKGRVVLSVEKDVPTVTLYTGELKQAVLLEAHPATGRGFGGGARQRPAARADQGRGRRFGLGQHRAR